MRYERFKSQDAITCLLCRHYCTLHEGKTGICGVNTNEGGKLKNLTYAHPSAIHIDPIEKKPLYHFLPSSKSLSIGTTGCNFRCPFCQNWSISQTKEIYRRHNFSPQYIVQTALQAQVESISYTYNEPTIWYPYAKDIGVLAKQRGIKNVFVSSGFESVEVLEDMPSWVDAANIDLKSFSKRYYKTVLKADLSSVLENLRFVAASSIWVEVTTLLIPGVNDSAEEIRDMAHFIASQMGKEVPWHLSAFHPDYKMRDTPPTPIEKMLEALQIAKEAGLLYVYLGNVAYENDTVCPNCNAVLIQRQGFYAKSASLLRSGRCSRCNQTIEGVWR